MYMLKASRSVPPGGGGGLLWHGFASKEKER